MMFTCTTPCTDLAHGHRFGAPRAPRRRASAQALVSSKLVATRRRGGACASISIAIT